MKISLERWCRKKTTFLFGYCDISNLIEYWNDAKLVIMMEVKPNCLYLRVSDIDWNIVSMFDFCDNFYILPIYS